MKPTLRAETRTLPEIIKKIRSGLGETQKKFGDRFGVSAPLVCQWESGYREPNASVFMFVLEHELAQAEAKAERTVYQCMCCGFRSDSVLSVHDCDWTRSIKIKPIFEALQKDSQ